MDSRTDRTGHPPPPEGAARYDVPPPTDARPQPTAEAPWAFVAAPPGATPPPPPAEPRLPAHDTTSRTTAASWVAATGALLLLVAAGTFLAVSWDALGLTARVAIVGSVTAAAIVGGYHLRRTLPAVGVVIFHLGALLLPIDAVGLGLQLGLPAATTWILAGAVALLALPPLAIAVRSRTLAAAALVGAPTVATGLGLAGVADPAFAVAVAGVLGLAALRLRGSRVGRIWRGTAVTLATVAVLVPLLAALLDVSLAEGQIVTAIRSAGWAPSGWLWPAIAGVLATLTVAAAARLRASRRLATYVPVVAVIATIVALLPEGTPRLAALLAAPVLLLLLQLVAMLVADDATLGAPFSWIAAIGELVAAAIAIVPVAVVVITPTLVISGDRDGELAAALFVAAAAWSVGVLRRAVGGQGRSGALPIVAGLAVLHAVAGLAALAPTDAAPVLPVLLTGLAGLALLVPLTDLEPAARRPVSAPSAASGPVSGATDGSSSTASASRWQAPAVVLVASALLFLACAAAFGTVVALPVAAVAAPILGLHLRALLVATHPHATLTTVVTLAPVVVIGMALGGLSEPAAATELGPMWTRAIQSGVQVVALLGTAVAVDRLRGAADAVRTLVLFPLLLPGAIRYVPDALTDTITTSAQLNALELLSPIPTLLAVLVPALVWLVIDAVRRERVYVAVVAAPVAARALAAGVAALGVGPLVLGIVLLAAGLAAVAIAVAIAVARGTRELGWPAGVFAVLTVPAGWALAAVAPEALSIALIALGTAGVVAGARRRSHLIGHGGGVIAILGIWSLFDLRAVTAVDLWLLPVAIQLVVAGMGARRRGRLSSWAIDVPPLLLVAIPALSERLADGPATHTLLAGLVAIVAIIYGGASGRGGPLTVGMLVILAVVTIETIAFAALVPTWAWFAGAGAVLIAAAVLIERHGLSPTRAVGKLRDLAADEPVDDARGPESPAASPSSTSPSSTSPPPAPAAGDGSVGQAPVPDDAPPPSPSTRAR